MSSSPSHFHRHTVATTLRLHEQARSQKTERGPVFLEALKREAAEGLAARLGKEVGKTRGAVPSAYRSRLRQELSLIAKSGQAATFLSAARMVRHARANGVPVGLGLGRNLTAFALGIVEMDPLANPLGPFRAREREFFSLEFGFDGGAGAMADFLCRAFQTENAAPLMGAKVAPCAEAAGPSSEDLFKSLCQRMAVSWEERGNVLFHRHESAGNWWNCWWNHPRVKAVAGTSPRLSAVFERLNEAWQAPLSFRASTHKFAVLLPGFDPKSLVPALDPTGAEGVWVCPFSEEDLETLGQPCFEIDANHPLRMVRRIDLALGGAGDGKALMEGIPLDDPATMRLFSRGETGDLPWFEGEEIRQGLRRARPRRFEELVHLLAFWRPDRKSKALLARYLREGRNGEDRHYPVKGMDAILDPTRGIVVYREQFEAITRLVSGFTWEETRGFDQFLGRKWPKEHERWEGRFLGGAKMRGIPAKKASQVFTQLQTEGPGRFPAPLAWATTLTAWRLAWLKVHHPGEYEQAWKEEKDRR